jgi:hypothetical protein
MLAALVLLIRLMLAALVLLIRLVLAALVLLIRLMLAALMLLLVRLSAAALLLARTRVVLLLTGILIGMVRIAHRDLLIGSEQPRPTV